MGMKWYKKALADKDNKQEIRPWILFGFILMGYEIRGQLWEFAKIFLRIGVLLNYELNTE